VFTQYLKQGSENDEVMELQKVLQRLGYLTVAPNGYFGPSTFAAVKKFQAAHGLDQLGAVGPGTRLELNSLSQTSTQSTPTHTAVSTGTYVFEHFMGVGDDDPDVLELQKRLVALGFLTAEPTGYYGAGTEAAVKKFQTKHGLPATGYVAKNTRAALNAQ
jgi:peptidoglycan hydrolase-like protein with peptidoglycan-binding domain